MSVSSTKDIVQYRDFDIPDICSALSRTARFLDYQVFFRPVSAGTLCEEWFGLSQEGTVKEYTRKFVELLLLMEDLQISDELMLANFKKGLEEEIKIELEMLWPETLDQAMDMAVRIEAKLKGQLG
ncbi:unnamed protein product [Amaranthus hypochondriacus]